jgi:hypothetical protein
MAAGMDVPAQAAETPGKFADRAGLFGVRVQASDVSKDDVLGEVPRGALISSAVFTVRAAPGGLSSVKQAGIVREGQRPANLPTSVPGGADAFVIDFQRLRTVTEVALQGLKIYLLLPWQGTQFAPTWQAIFSSATGEHDAVFAEVQTERLLVLCDPPSASDVTPADEVAGRMRVSLPAPPSDLELLVNGKRVWTRPGAVRPERDTTRPRADDDFFVVDVELADEVQRAAAAGDVTVTLKTAVPGIIGLSHRVAFQRVHEVVFPESDPRTVVTAAEGFTSVALPVPAAASSWRIDELRMVVAAELPATRVQPASGPDPSDGAVLLLDAEHTVVARVADTQLEAFAALSGIRVPLRAAAGGAEVAAVVRADAAGAPGDIVPGPSLGPLQIAASETPAWITLAFPRAVKVARRTPLWFALQVSRGRAEWPVSAPAGTPQNPIRIGLPSGPFRALPAIPAVAPSGLSAIVRLLGESSTDAPIPALDAWVAGNDKRASFTPAADGLPVSLVMSPSPALGSDAAVVAGGAVQLQLRASTAGTFKFRSVSIIYRLPTDPSGA